MFTETKTEKQCQIYSPGKSCKELLVEKYLKNK